MAFWSENPPDKDPKRNFRFVVRVAGFGKDTGNSQGYMWFAKTAVKPSFAIAAAEHKFLNHTFYYPGSVTWNDVTVTLVDPQDPSTVMEFAKMIQAGGYVPPGTQNALGTMSKGTAVGATGKVEIAQLNAEGTEIEQWTLWNAWVTDIKFGDSLEYGNDDLTEVSVTFKYDWAQVQAGSDDAIAVFGVNSSTEAE